MLNVLIIIDRVSRKAFLNFFDWKKHGVNKLVTSNDITKTAFKNYDDIDFIISDAETLTMEECKLINQITEYKLNDRLIVFGEGNNTQNIKKIMTNGLNSYYPDINCLREGIAKTFRDRILEKENENLFILQLQDGSVAKKTRQALEKGDSRLIQKVISGGAKFLPKPIFQIKEYYLLILKTVFEFAEEKGVRHIEKKDVISELLEQSDFESLRDCALKKTNSIVHLVEVNKNNQNKMVAAYIKDYIDENYMKQDTNAGNIADKFGVSGSYIGMLFREQHKTTITKYITQLRINKSAELLADTKLQIQVISKRVGYSDQNYFARIFKKQTGLSPGEYRNKCSH